jgi:rhodanese-related sulfurtransferase
MVEELVPRDLAARLKSAPGELFLLDVREPDEREAAAILPSAHIPMRDVPARIAELPKDKEIVVYCHTGMRSMMIAGFLESRGFDRVTNLAGGIDAWSVTVDPSVPRYG